MDKNFYAVIIGFNKFSDQTYLPELEYAEKDARDLFDALIDPNCGNFPKENIHLITGNVSRQDVEEQLYVHAVHDRGPQDTVLIYYSGHGFIAGDNPESYLATPDTYVMKVVKNPNAALPMEFLRKNIFLAQPEKRAKHMILLLDCCYSGAFCPDLKSSLDARPRSLVEANDFNSEGRVAFVSSPAGVVSREDKNLKNGIFTYYLLAGLRGEAIEKHKGEVTVSSLISYVQSMCPSTQPPISYGKSPRIILTSPRLNNSTVYKDPATQSQRITNFSSLFSKQELVSVPLRSPMEKQIECMDNLLQHLGAIEKNPGGKTILGNQILNGIRTALQADFAFVEQLRTRDDSLYKFLCDLPTNSISPVEYADQVLGEIFPLIIQDKAKLLPTRFGFSIETVDVKGVANNTIVIPLRLEYPREFLIISGIHDSVLEYGEILGHTLLSLYRATLEFSTLDITKVENFLLDELRRSYGHVPYAIYCKRFSKFKDHLHQIGFAYEPVVSLGKKEVEIDSWEALARDPASKHAPYELFQAAELWGPEFTTELDIYCLRNAVTSYSEIWHRERKGEKMDALAVNVYPETLFRKAYFQELNQIIKKDELIKGKKLILEISEKRPLSWVDRLENKYVVDPTGTFALQLQDISKTFGIAFAIDDFGVGHSSADRLARLKLDHVKIDRDILHHPFPQHTIRYVLDIVQSSHVGPVKVVIEGFDGESRISLSELYNDLGIIYIQGHLIRKAAPSVVDLDEEIKNFIIHKINIDDEQMNVIEDTPEEIEPKN